MIDSFVIFTNQISRYIIPFLLVSIPFYGLFFKKIKVYELFVDGAKDGFTIAVRIIPYLVAILVAIGMFRASGALNILLIWLTPFLNFVGFPPENLPLALMRPLSGSGSLGLLTDLIDQHGQDSLISKIGATMYGSTETTFYVLAVYFGSVGIKKSRHALISGLLADLAGIIAAVFLCQILFGDSTISQGNHKKQMTIFKDLKNNTILLSRSMFKTLRYSIMLKTVPLIIIISCGGDQRIETVFNEELENIKSRYTPDRALDVFSINLKKKNSKWVLSGETTDENAFTRTYEIADSLFGKANVINNILLLPDAALNDSIFGIINVSVSPLREEPRHSSQMVDQAIMGSTINLLKKQDDWYLVQTDYDYIGWMNKTSISVTDTNGIENWENKINYRVSSLYASVFSLPYETSQPVSDIILNNMMIGKRKSNDWITVTLPDGRSGFVKERKLELINPNQLKYLDTEKILLEAYKMTGVPYLWGGNSSKANDCSGFTQTVFKTIGDSTS